MRAACLVAEREGVVVQDVEIDQPIGREVVIRTNAVGLCHSDLHVVDGTLARPRPLVLGHEAAGIVEAVGPDVGDVRVGDHVVTCLVAPCGTCARCALGEEHLCVGTAFVRRPAGAAPRLHRDGVAVGQMAGIGALAERILVDERAVTVIPAEMPDELAALLGCAVVTGLGSVFNVARVGAGQRVVVIGCGGIGLSIVQGARIAGAAQVVAVDVSADKLDLASRLGATHGVDASAAGGDAVAAVIAATDGGADHVFEAVGRPATVHQAIAMAAPGRTVYVVGMLPDGASVSVPAAALRRCITLTGVFMGAAVPRRDIPAYVELWQRGELDLATMVSDVLPPERVGEGFAALAAGRVARAVIGYTGAPR